MLYFLQTSKTCHIFSCLEKKSFISSSKYKSLFLTCHFKLNRLSVIDIETCKVC